MKLLSIAIAAMAVAAALGAGTASAAAPRIIIVSGKPLAQQVVIANWQAIFAVVNEVLNARVVQRRQLAGRPSLKLSMFWGPPERRRCGQNRLISSGASTQLGADARQGSTYWGQVAGRVSSRRRHWRSSSASACRSTSRFNSLPMRSASPARRTFT